MRSLSLSMLLSLFVGGIAAAEEVVGLSREEEPDRWRVSVGLSIVGVVSPRIGVNHAALSAASGFFGGFGGPGGGRSRAEAFAAGSGASDPNGVRRFDNGAWYDPHDSAYANDSDWSWNWRLHDPQSADPAGRRGFVEYTEYSQSYSSASMTTASGYGGSSDSSEWFPGLHIGLERELYRSDDERPWGVDLGLGFSYYFRRGLWKAGGVVATGSIERRQEKGMYEWWNDSGDTAKYILDYERDTQFSDGMWGSGGFGGPGAELQSSAWNFRDLVYSSEHSSASHILRYYGDGDYQEFSFELIARPWWEPYSWLRVFGSLGVELSRRSFDWSMAVGGTDGSAFHESGEASDWCFSGLVGGGVSLRWNDFVLAGEGLYRFGGDGLGVDGLAVNGEIEHADWILRLTLGYEF